jgi:undecaprenyl-diphosphatase
MPAIEAFVRRRNSRDARIVGLAAGTFLTFAQLARQGTVSAGEEAAFRAFNDLSPTLRVPVWASMQAGSLAAVGVAAAAAWPFNRRTSVALGGAGTAAWGLAKVTKRFVRRGRPAQHLDEVRIHGTAQRGLGFPSGHSAVAMTLAIVGSPLLRPLARRAAWLGVGLVAADRQYVGAHLPLDVVGGLALGVLCGTAARLVDTVR